MPPMKDKRLRTFGIPIEDSAVAMRVRWVQSSNIDWIGWPKSGEPLMVVQFSSKDRYGYLGVSRQKAVACAFAKSTGKFLNDRIKPHYEAVRIR
jgi:KTSC domain